MCHLLSASLFLLSGIFQHFLFILDIPQFKTRQSMNLLLFTLLRCQYLWWGLTFFLNAWNVRYFLLKYSVLFPSFSSPGILFTCMKIHSICPLCQLLFEISVSHWERELHNMFFKFTKSSVLCLQFKPSIYFISIYLLCV